MMNCSRVVDIIPLLVRNTERWMDAIWRYLGHGKVFQAAAERCQMFWSLPIPINLIIKYILLHKTDDVCAQARMLSHLNGSFVWVMSLKNFLLHKSIQQSDCGPSDLQIGTISRNYLPWWLLTMPHIKYDFAKCFSYSQQCINYLLRIVYQHILYRSQTKIIYIEACHDKALTASTKYTNMEPIVNETLS